MVASAKHTVTLAAILAGLAHNVDAACKCVSAVALRSVHLLVCIVETSISLT